MVSANNGLAFPQDPGTGLSSIGDGDYTSAAHFAGLAAQSDLSGYVDNGMGLANVSGGTFDINAGLAFLYFSGSLSSQDSNGDYTRTWDSGASFVVQADSTTGISYTTGSVNEVFVSLNLATNNDVQYTVSTDGTTPSDPYVKIAEIDDTGSSPAVSEFNQKPPLQVELESYADSAYTDEDAQDAVGTITSGGDKITVTYDDTNDSLTIDTSALDTEEVEDTVNNLLVGGTDISLTYDDANSQLTIDASTFSGSHTDLTDITSDDHHTRYADSEARLAVAAEPLQLYTVTSDPSSPGVGTMWYRSDLD